MGSERIEWGTELAQAASEIADVAKDAGIPAIGLLGRFAQHFYSDYLNSRFRMFAESIELDNEFVQRILADETYANCFYAILETVRQTHSKLGLATLARIYHEHWNDEVLLVAAAQSFSQISDRTINAFILLYEGIPADTDHLDLRIRKDDQGYFHDRYNEAVELIRRNFFVMSAGPASFANGPVQGMKWEHTDLYYRHCKAAKLSAES